jgi:hypothetical protein
MTMTFSSLLSNLPTTLYLVAKGQPNIPVFFKVAIVSIEG